MKPYNWENEYKNSELLWGLKPNSTLMQYAELVPAAGKVLDIGIGEGRNAFFFAQKGCAVEGIDLSETAIERCKTLSKKYQLNIEAHVEDVETFDIKPNQYSLIILSNVLNFIPEPKIAPLLDQVKRGLTEDGFVYVNAFDIDEPSRQKAVREYERLGENSFFIRKNGMYIHYFRKGELEEYFRTYKTIKTGYSYALDLSYGEPHYHSTIEILAQKQRGLDDIDF